MYVFQFFSSILNNLFYFQFTSLPLQKVFIEWFQFFYYYFSIEIYDILVCAVGKFNLQNVLNLM